MSGPIPAGSPRVSASGRDMASALPVFDHSLIAQFLEVPLGGNFEGLIEHLVANLFFRRPALGLPLAAQRIDFDALRRDLRRGQPANLGLRQYVAQLRWQ